MKKRAWGSWESLLGILMWAGAGLWFEETAPPSVAAADLETTLHRETGEIC